MTDAEPGLADEVAALRGALTAALERETGTAEVLRVIGANPTSLDAVFEALAQTLARLCNAPFVSVAHVQQGTYRAWANIGAEMRLERPAAGTFISTALRTARPVHVVGPTAAWANDFPDAAALNRDMGRTALAAYAAPVLRGDVAIGAVLVIRDEPQPFSAAERALIETFADQAVIAIENARLVSELQESLAQQTATAEVLGIISGSPGDQDAALTAITEAAFRLCHADGARVFLRDGDHLVGGPLASTRRTLGIPDAGTRLPLDPIRPVGQAILENRTVRVDDLVQHMAEHGAAPDEVERIRSENRRSTVFVPLVRGGTSIGVLSVLRAEVRPFSDQEVALAEAFAAQAVIAIENARLLNELQESLEHQRATSEVLEVISHAPADLQRVIDAIVTRAAALTGSGSAALSLVRGAERHTVSHLTGGAFLAEERLAAPRVIVGEEANQTMHAVAARERRTITSHGGAESILAQHPYLREVFSRTRASGRLPPGSVATTPLLRDGVVFGWLNVRRDSPAAYSPAQIALLETFAGQAVVAMENARLFEELQTRTQADRAERSFTHMGR